MPEELTELEKDIRDEYKGVLACFDGLVEGLPRVVADLSHGGHNTILTVLMGVESSHCHWRLSDHYLDLRRRLDETIRYGEMLVELINTADELSKPVQVADPRTNMEIVQEIVKARDAAPELVADCVTFTVDGEEFTLTCGIYDADQILEVAGRTPGYDVLILIDDEFPNGFREVRNKIYLKEGMEFSARPPTGQATQTTKGE